MSEFVEASRSGESGLGMRQTICTPIGQVTFYHVVAPPWCDWLWWELHYMMDEWL